MASISILKEQFDNLPVSKENMELYKYLLLTDISDFKPVMEQILLGKLDIEDTRKLLYNQVNYNWLTSKGRSLIKDVRLSTNIMDTIRENIIARLNGDEKALIKESIIFPDQSQIKHQIALEFFERTGVEMDQEDIEILLPIINTELFIELSLDNPNANKDKAHQSLFSDILAFKPNAEL